MDLRLGEGEQEKRAGKYCETEANRPRMEERGTSRRRRMGLNIVHLKIL